MGGLQTSTNQTMLTLCLLAQTVVAYEELEVQGCPVIARSQGQDSSSTLQPRCRNDYTKKSPGICLSYGRGLVT